MIEQDTPSWRKPVGMLAIVALLAIWAVAAVSLIDALSLPPWAQAIAFLVAGVAWLWLFPMRRLLRWMELGIWRG